MLCYAMLCLFTLGAIRIAASSQYNTTLPIRSALILLLLRDASSREGSQPRRSWESSPFSGGSDLERYFDDVHDGPGVWKWRHYLDIYTKHLARFRGAANFTFVEIGVYSGGSLRMWRHFFGERARIVGVDLSPKVLAYENTSEYGSPQIFVGDQCDTNFWRRALAHTGPVDVLLDDGSHKAADQIATLQAVWPHLSRGGVYMTEDLMTYNQAFTQHIVERFVLGNEGINGRGKPVNCSSNRRILAHKREGCNFPPKNELQAQLAEVSFYPQMVVLEKYPRDSRGKRFGMHGSSWMPPLRNNAEGKQEF